MIAGQPLVYWAVDAAVNTPQISKVYISTDSEDIERVVAEYDKPDVEKVEVIGRSPETATDTASTESAMLEFAENYEFENIILIQATSPLISSKDLKEAITKYEEENYDSMLSVVPQKRFVWNYNDDGSVSPQNYDYKNRPRRQEFDGFLVENGAFYITKKKNLLNQKCRLSGRIGCYEMDEKSYYEIDDTHDWLIIEEVLKNMD
jgi:N-acylneuraminate cytidylyltransferase